MKECPNKNCWSAGPGPLDVFCYKCGTKLVDKTKCECGYELCKADAYCPICGKQKGAKDD